MRWVYSTYTTPSGGRRGPRWMNKAGTNYCIYILQNFKSWNHLQGNHRVLVMFLKWYPVIWHGNDFSRWNWLGKMLVMNRFKSISKSIIMNLIIINILRFVENFSLCNSGIIYLVMKMSFQQNAIKMFRSFSHFLFFKWSIITFGRGDWRKFTSTWSCTTRPSYMTLTADSRMLNMNLFIMKLSIPFRSAKAQFQGDVLGSRKVWAITQRPTTPVKRPRFKILNWFCLTDDFCGFSSGNGNQSQGKKKKWTGR